MIDEEMILGAVVKALQPLTVIEDPNRFAFEVSGVLNRFKTNLYLMMDESETRRDPNELINITITGGAELSYFGGRTDILRRDRTILRVYGVRGIGSYLLEQGQEFMVSTDITDLYPPERLVAMHKSHFLSRRVEGLPTCIDDTDRFNALDYVDPKEHGCYFNTERILDHRALTEMTISGRVHSKALERVRRRTSEKHPGSEKTYIEMTNMEKYRAQQKEERARGFSLIN